MSENRLAKKRTLKGKQNDMMINHCHHLPPTLLLLLSSSSSSFVFDQVYFAGAIASMTTLLGLMLLHTSIEELCAFFYSVLLVYQQLRVHLIYTDIYNGVQTYVSFLFVLCGCCIYIHQYI